MTNTKNKIYLKERIILILVAFLITSIGYVFLAAADVTSNLSLSSKVILFTINYIMYLAFVLGLHLLDIWVKKQGI